MLIHRRDPGSASVGPVKAALPVGCIVAGAVQGEAETVEDRVLVALLPSSNKLKVSSHCIIEYMISVSG